jgi:hypothetical protein
MAMSKSIPPFDDELTELLEAVANRDLTSNQRKRLAERLAEDSDARKAFIQATALDAMLSYEFPATEFRVASSVLEIPESEEPSAISDEDFAALRDRAEAELLAPEPDTANVVSPSSNVSARNHSRWSSAAALLIVGAVAGCLFTGAAWAFANSRTPETVVLPVAVMNGGFETHEAITSSHYPREPGVWSGDPVTIVASGEQDILPFDGTCQRKCDDEF